jgi:hypothetical protein
MSVDNPGVRKPRHRVESITLTDRLRTLSKKLGRVVGALGRNETAVPQYEAVTTTLLGHDFGEPDVSSADRSDPTTTPITIPLPIRQFAQVDVQHPDANVDTELSSEDLNQAFPDLASAGMHVETMHNWIGDDDPARLLAQIRAYRLAGRYRQRFDPDASTSSPNQLAMEPVTPSHVLRPIITRPEGNQN